MFVCRGSVLPCVAPGLSSKTFLSRDVTNRLRAYLLSEVEVYQVWDGGGGALKEEEEGVVSVFVCSQTASHLPYL